MASCIINLTSMMCVAHATSTGGVKSREVSIYNPIEMVKSMPLTCRT